MAFGQSATVAPPRNEGGVVVVLFLLMVAISYAMFSAVALYATTATTRERKETRLMRLLSGWANVGNGVVHALLIMVLYANRDSPLKFYVAELEEGLAGPAFLMIINSAVGLSSLRGGGPKLAVGWNVFVAFAGTLLPIVWLRFIEDGLATWPYVIVFIWIAIFAMELTAVTCSVTWYALKDLK